MKTVKESRTAPRRKDGRRVVGDLTGKHAQLLWSPQDIAAKTDGRFSETQVRNDIEAGKKIPPEAITQNGRIKLVQLWAVRDYLNIHKST